MWLNVEDTESMCFSIFRTASLFLAYAPWNLGVLTVDKTHETADVTSS